MSDVKSLPVMETFYTVQGEGAYTGAPAFFIRLAGCDVGCTWCDVKESWNAELHPKISVSDLTSMVVNAGAVICVITGGEPMMHNLEDLTNSLRSSGIRTHLETSGVYPITGIWDWITFSPKKFKKPVEQIYDVAHELKVIVFHPSDIPWAEEHAARLNEGCKLFLQPEWEKRDKMQPLILDFIRRNTQWRISVQTHKYLGVD